MLFRQLLSMIRSGFSDFFHRLVYYDNCMDKMYAPAYTQYMAG